MLGLKLWGGLGNQMFIYALYKKLKLMNRDIRIDDSDLVKSGNQHNGEELRRVFGLDFETLSAKDKEKIIGRSFYKRINRKI